MRAGGLPFHLPHVGRNLQAPPNSKHGALAPTAKVSKVGLIESRKVGLRQGSKHITMDAIRVKLKICHLAEFTLAVEPGLAIMIFITKWLLKRAGILIGP